MEVRAAIQTSCKDECNARALIPQHETRDLGPDGSGFRVWRWGAMREICI